MDAIAQRGINNLTPETNFDVVLVLYLRKIGFWIGEVVGIESERAPKIPSQRQFGTQSWYGTSLPLVLFHPEAIQVEDSNRAASLLHSFEKTRNCLAGI